MSEPVQTVAAIVQAHRTGRVTPVDTVKRVFARIREYNDPAMFITLRSEDDLLAEASDLLAQGNADQPLFGVPIAVKDNIDVAGIATTAGCPDFAYKPRSDATVVAKLRAAGALVIGKTNLDQFATGLVGTRSPYGVPRNAIRRDLIPGGSSSGSAVVVAAGIVPVALGTDTAGSGRVPAMLNNIVGMKPSLGLVSTAGVVPACRTLDAVSIFALTVEDAFAVLAVIKGNDPNDSYSRDMPLGHLPPPPPHFRIGVPGPSARMFFGDELAAAAYDEALDGLERLGGTLHEIDFAPFFEAARLLYDGPWLAERFLVARALLESSPESIYPVTRQIISAGARSSAADAFAAFYRLEDLRRAADAAFRKLDVLAIPTAPTVYTIAEVAADPISTNSRLGTYTNFVNLLNLCGIAVPAAICADGAPFGISLLAPAGRDAYVASIGRAFYASTQLTLGATNAPYPAVNVAERCASSGNIEVAVFGAHLSGLALNNELVARGGNFVRSTRTTQDYRFYLLPGGPPTRPGLVRVGEEQGASIEAEIWAMPAEGLGNFVSEIPVPLCIGTVQFADGTCAKGFLAESAGLAGARDITEFGGWRAFRQAEAAERTAFYPEAIFKP